MKLYRFLVGAALAAILGGPAGAQTGGSDGPVAPRAAAATAMRGQAAPQGPAVTLSPNALRLVQQQLTQLGLDPGPPSGALDERTANALRAYQAANNIEPTGAIDTATLSCLGGPQGARPLVGGTYAASSAAAFRGSTNGGQGAPLFVGPAQAGLIRETLNKRGISVGELGGAPDKETIAALREFQSAHNLEPTGAFTAAMARVLGVGDLAFLPPCPAGGGGPAPGTVTQRRGAAASPGVTITLGSATVRRIQRALNQAGLLPGDPSGEWDASTQKAVKQFQQSNALAPTGTPTTEFLGRIGMSNWFEGLDPENAPATSRQGEPEPPSKQAAGAAAPDGKKAGSALGQNASNQAANGAGGLAGEGLGGAGGTAGPSGEGLPGDGGAGDIGGAKGIYAGGGGGKRPDPRVTADVISSMFKGGGGKTSAAAAGDLPIGPYTIVAILGAIAAAATAVTIVMPLLQTDTLGKRMRSVATEREKLRAKQRERLANRDVATLRTEPKAYMKKIVDDFSLKKWLGTDTARLQLTQAGFRGAQAEIAFLFFRLIVPLSLFAITLVYAFLIFDNDYPAVVKVGAAIGGAYAGIKAPELYLKNVISKRRLSMRRAFPDAMDLLLICVESGMAIEPAFRRVGGEIGVQSVPLAEEFALATAELSFLPERRLAYENFALRTGIEVAKQISTVLIQAEKYGTPLGQALRVVGQESRDARMMEAEKRAAALPPKLTVPMIVFFLPVLFAVIMTPAILQIVRTQ